MNRDEVAVQVDPLYHAAELPPPYRAMKQPMTIAGVVRTCDTTKAAARIRASLLEPGSRFTSDPSLATGHAGVAVFFAEMESRGGINGGYQMAREHLERALQLQSSHGTHAGLFAGLAGVVWAASHLNRRFPAFFDIDVSDALELLLMLIAKWPADGCYDIASGVTGILLAFLECEASSIREAGVLASLEWLEQRGAAVDGRPWRTTRHLLPKTLHSRAELGAIDLGMAHGVLGVAAGVLIAAAAGYESEASYALVEQVQPIVRRNLLRDAEAVALPPLDIAGVPPSDDQLAWCYGRLGLSILDQHGAALTGALKWPPITRSWDRQVQQVDALLERIRDASICHGAVGLELLLAWLGRSSESMPYSTAPFGRYLQTRIGWTERSVPRFHVPKVQGNYAEYRPGLLEGEAGVMLGAWTVADSGAWDWTAWLGLARTVHHPS